MMVITITDRTPLSESGSILIAMILPVFTLTLQPAHPLHFSLEDLRTFFSRQLTNHARLSSHSVPARIYRYPVIQGKQIKNRLMVIGISQGADLLWEHSLGNTDILSGVNTCTIIERDVKIRKETIGLSDTRLRYEFLTPWLALNQQNAKKFYDLQGKTQRDAFMHKILTGNLITFAKSIDYHLTDQLMCSCKVRFKRERIHNENVMVFSGSFETNLMIPDYLGIGQSISQGFGTIRSVVDDSGTV